MMRKGAQHLALTLFLLLAATSSYSAVPQLISYQGNLTDSGGQPLTGNFLMNFSLYSVASGGSSLWNEQQSVAIQNGIFSVNLGSVAAFSGSEFGSSELYLEVQISNGSWEQLSPRQRLTSTLFSYRAADSDALAGYTISDLDLRYGQHEVPQLPRNNIITTLDSAGDVGQYSSITIGNDGLPIISYYDRLNSALKVTHCTDSACTGSTITTLDSSGRVGEYSSIAIGSDGLPVIAYFDGTNQDLKVAHCSDTSCNTATITTPADTGTTNPDLSIAIAGSGFPVISYHNSSNGDLLVAQCTDIFCTRNIAIITTLDSAGFVGPYTSITTGSDGLPVVSYYDGTNQDLKVAHCNDAGCTSATITTLDSIGNAGNDTSITIGNDGLPIISYRDGTNQDLKVAHCSDTPCSTATISTLDSAGLVGYDTSITVGNDGLPIISYFDATNQDLKIAHCSNPSCTSATARSLDNVGEEGGYTAITIGSDGLPIISYYDMTNYSLKTLKCANQFCVNNFSRR